LRDILIDKFLSQSRLGVYNDFTQYEQNLKDSKHYYILLAILEVSLRNSISDYFSKHIDNNWMENDFLNNNSKKRIKEVKSRLSQRSDSLSTDKILAELSFGFWTALFRKDYAPIMRTKAIKHIFPNLPSKDERFIDRNYINKKLNHIRVFRNRIFHYEKIINKSEFSEIDADIYEILEFFDTDIKEFAQRLNNG